MVHTLKRSLAALCATLVLAGSAATLVHAQTTAPTPDTQMTRAQHRQEYMDAVAKRLGITTSQLEAAFAGARTDLGLPPAGSPTGSEHHHAKPATPEP
jgi:hypothetical protein